MNFRADYGIMIALRTKDWVEISKWAVDPDQILDQIETRMKATTSTTEPHNNFLFK